MVVLVVLLLLLVGSFALTARELWRARRAAPPPSPAPALQGQLLFAAAHGTTSMGLDCLLRHGPQRELAGMPVHLVASLPASPDLAARERDQVRRWLDGTEPIDVELVLTAARPQVTLACNATVLTLPIP
jgi:hypothetical protein